MFTNIMTIIYLPCAVDLKTQLTKSIQQNLLLKPISLHGLLKIHLKRIIVITGLSVETNRTESLCAFDIGYQSEVSKHPLLQRSTYSTFYLSKDNFKTVICAA